MDRPLIGSSSLLLYRFFTAVIIGGHSHGIKSVRIDQRSTEVRGPQAEGSFPDFIFRRRAAKEGEPCPPLPYPLLNPLSLGVRGRLGIAGSKIPIDGIVIGEFLGFLLSFGMR